MRVRTSNWFYFNTLSFVVFQRNVPEKSIHDLLYLSGDHNDDNSTLFFRQNTGWIGSFETNYFFIFRPIKKVNRNFEILD
jgi:hypothetical protein